jgi:hypothetical protein
MFFYAAKQYIFIDRGALYDFRRGFWPTIAAAPNMRDTDPALWDDLRIARMLRGTRRLQAFLTVRKRPEFSFQAQVLFAGIR